MYSGIACPSWCNGICCKPFEPTINIENYINTHRIFNHPDSNEKFVILGKGSNENLVKVELETYKKLYELKIIQI